MSEELKPCEWEIGLMSGNASVGFTQEIYCGGDSWVYVKRPFAQDATRDAFALIAARRATPADGIRSAEREVVEAAMKLNAMWGDAQVNIGPTELALYKALAALASAKEGGA